MKLGFIVEGHGDVPAITALVRRLISPGVSAELLQPYRLPRGKFQKEDEFKRAVELVARQVDQAGAILIVLDSDDDCPVTLAAQLLEWANQQRGDHRIAVVVANMEFEAWFIAAIASLAGKRGLSSSIVPPSAPESIRDAKGWLSRHMKSPYRETLDQPAFAALFDIDEASSSRSFRKLRREVAELTHERQ